MQANFRVYHLLLIGSRKMTEQLTLQIKQAGLNAPHIFCRTVSPALSKIRQSTYPAYTSMTWRAKLSSINERPADHGFCRKKNAKRLMSVHIVLRLIALDESPRPIVLASLPRCLQTSIGIGRSPVATYAAGCRCATVR